MGTLRLGSILADIRGSVGNQVYGRGPGGLFVRDRITPAQPTSPERLLRQQALAAIGQAWSTVLTPTQRADWRAYAAQHPLTGKWGQPLAGNGFGTFVRSNIQEYRTETAIMHLTAPAQPYPANPITTLAASEVLRWSGAGDPVPDSTGGYQDRGTYNGQPWAKHDNLEYYNWYGYPPECWRITTALGSLTTKRWAAGQTRAAAYGAGGTATGTITLTAADPGYAFTFGLPPLTILEPPTNLKLFAYLSNQRNAGVLYHSSPFRYAGTNQWDGAAWTEDPWTISWLDFYEDAGAMLNRAITTPSQFFAAMVAVLDDGATSARGYMSCSIT